MVCKDDIYQLSQGTSCSFSLAKLIFIQFVSNTNLANNNFFSYIFEASNYSPIEFLGTLRADLTDFTEFI